MHIFYVVDLTRFWTGPGQPDPHISDPEVQKSYYYVDTGLIAQNVYLFAASQGLVSWFHNCHADAAGKVFGLGPKQRVLFAAVRGKEGAVKRILTRRVLRRGCPALPASFPATRPFPLSSLNSLAEGVAHARASFRITSSKRRDPLGRPLHPKREGGAVAFRVRRARELLPRRPA